MTGRDGWTGGWRRRTEAADERLVSQMRDQLTRLRDRHRQLESRYFDDDGLMKEPVAPHVSRLMRDRHVASLRVLLQRNMDSIEREMQDTIRRLGNALTERDDDRNEDDDDDEAAEVHSTTSASSYPDVIPRPSLAASPAPDPAADGARSGEGDLPLPGNPDRRFVLGAVKEILEKRSAERAAPADVATAPPLPAATVASTPRVAFYEFRHPEPDDTGAKLNRLSVQKLPSVTIATSEKRSAVFSVQSPSVNFTPAEPGSIVESEPVAAATARPSADEQPQSDDAAAAANRPDVRPDDVARVVSDILAGQVELALDSFCAFAAATAPPVATQRTSDSEDDDDDDDGHIQFPLTIDSCTQTARPSFRDAFTLPEAPPMLVDRAAGPIKDAYLVDRATQKDADDAALPFDEPLTPPRCGIRIAPGAALDCPDAWRRRFPDSPPPTCPSPEAPAGVTADVAAPRALDTSSSTDEAARMSLLSASTPASRAADKSSGSSSAGASNSTSADIGTVSWLSEGEVPNRVASPGLAHSTTTTTAASASASMAQDRSLLFSTLSEGQVLVSAALNRFVSTPLGGSSIGEVPVFRVLTPTRSESTASFQSATESPGEFVPADHLSTADDVTNQLDSD